MHVRDVFFSHTVSVDVDPDIADIVEDELGEAARWFEHLSTDGTDVTYELRVGTAHMADVSDEEARESAEEYATEMFEKADSPFPVEDLTFVEVIDPESDDAVDEAPAGTDPTVSSEPVTDTDTDTDTDIGENDTLAEAMGGGA